MILLTRTPIRKDNANDTLLNVYLAIVAAASVVESPPVVDSPPAVDLGFLGYGVVVPSPLHPKP